MTRVLGLDPGSRVTGYGVVKLDQVKVEYVASGCIRVAKLEMMDRLKTIYESVSEIIADYDVNEVAIESIFVAHNVQSALKLGQARGAALAAAAHHELKMSEYAATLVKKSITGVGRATKEQMQFMVTKLLHLDESPPADAADALAVAICRCRELHVNSLRKLP